MGRNEEAKESRPQSPLPAPSRSLTPFIREPRADREAPIDLTNTPSEEPRAKIPPLPPPATLEVEPIAPAAEPAPKAAPTEEAIVEEPPQTVAPMEGAPSASDPAPAAPAPARTAEEDEADMPSFRSILEHHGRWAEQTMAQVCVPKLQRVLQNQGTFVFFHEASVAHLWAMNSLAAIKGDLSQAEATLGHLNEEVSQAQAKAEKAEKALEVARAEGLARAERAGRALEAVRVEGLARAERAEAKVEAARSEGLARARRAEEALEEAQRQVACELDNAWAAGEKQRMAESEVFVLKNRLHSAIIEIKVAEERAENAEEIARRSDAEIADLKMATMAAKEKIISAEKKASETVESFRQSTSYEEELAGATAFVYNVGFQDCKAKVSRIYGLEGIGDLEPDDEEEDPSPNDDPAPSES